MAYTNSPLVAYKKLSPNHSGQRTHSIDRITPHCVVGQCTAEGLGDWFALSSTQASSNYGIDKDGRVGLYVEEKNRSWCSSSSSNDQRAITIECASDTSEPYAFRDVVYQTLIKLCVDICQRNGKKKLLWLGDKDKTLNYNPAADEMILTVHRWFANKSCPGNWMYARMGDLASKVTAQLRGTEKEPEKTTGMQASAFANLSEGDVIKKVGSLFTADQKKSGILASVSLAQFILESGYGKTELAQKANNCFGMKKSLSGNTWSGSTWDGKSVYTKKTQEDDGTGRLYTITAEFRKYPCVEDSIGDHSAYLLGAKNGNNLRYTGLKGCTDYKKAIQIIKDGGYATDTSYMSKICSIIERWSLTQYDVKQADLVKPIADRAIHDITKENLSEVPAKRGNNKIEFIVVHYLGVPNADNPYLYGGGYGGHYNVKRDGSIYKAADPKTAVVWHCGGGLQGEEGHTFHGICTNYNSIGIECGVCYTDTSVKDASGDSDQWYFTTETQESLVFLVSKLMEEYGISADHVIRHYDVTGKICPNPYVKNNRLRTSWTWDEFKARLIEYRKSHGYTPEEETKPVTWYRVRKSWSDSKSQKGAYKILANAKKCADENPGYSVFDSDGKCIYTPKVAAPEPAKAGVPFLVKVGIDNLNIRQGPGTNFARTQYIHRGVYTIVDTASGSGASLWGKLKSGAGWISLDYCTRL